MNGYQALHDLVAYFDLSTRGRIRATGEDRARLLHALSTNHVQDLGPGQTLYAFFLNAQGRILSDAYIFCGDDHLLIDVEPEAREKILAHIDRYIIADDVTLEDITEATAEIAVEGPGSQALKEGLAADAVLLDASYTGQAGFRVVLPAAQKLDLVDALRSRGAVAASPEEIETVRIEFARPRYGPDIGEVNLAQETGIGTALHFNKGCYLGQEIVERVRSRGHVNKVLTALRIAGAEIPELGTAVLAGEAQMGSITSAAYSPRNQCVRALAYLRLELARGKQITVGGAPAEIA